MATGIAFGAIALTAPDLKRERGAYAGGKGEQKAYEDRNVAKGPENPRNIAAIVKIKPDKEGRREQSHQKEYQFPGHRSPPVPF